MVTTEKVMQALKGMRDPEINISILDLGMVRSVEVQGNTVHVSIALTVPDCPLTTTIRDDVTKAVSEIGGVEKLRCISPR